MIKIKNFIIGLVSMFPIGVSTIICYSYAIGNTTGKQLFLFMLLLFVFCAYMLYKVYKPVKQEQSEPEKPGGIDEPETIYYADPETAEKKRQAAADIETYSLMIEQYAELSEMIENELQYTMKETNRRKLKEKQINLENKIHTLETKRNKAYYILHN